jgi:thimet oligopeptidase
MSSIGSKSLEQYESTGILPSSGDDVKVLCNQALTQAKKAVELLVSRAPSDRTFDNSVVEVDRIMDDLDLAGSAAYLLMEVHPDKAVRETCQACVMEMEKYGTELMLRRDFYEAVMGKPVKGLKGEDAQYYKDLKLAFQRSGVNLPEEKRKEVQKVRNELTELETEFSKNIAADKSTLKAKASELKGLPPRVLESLKKEGDFYILGMDYPTYTAVMENVDVEETRKRMQQTFNNRAYPANVPLLETIIEKRDHLSRLLGYDNYAAYQLEDSMAKSPKAVKDFLDDLRKKARTKAEKDFKELVAMKRKVTGNPKAEVYAWDRGYLKNKIKEENYKIDEQKIAEYFPVENTVAGLFEISQKLYSVRFKEIQPSWKWHEDVKLYEVWSVPENKFIGRFYTDLYPRPDKYSHAAKFGLVAGKKLSGKDYRIPTVAIVANFPKATKDTPALLKHDDVETFFHEFGHCLHSLLTEAKYSSHSGTSVARDFVEAPSQMFENWVWDEQSLKLFARHYKTKEVLPPSLLKSMIAAKNLGSGLDTQQQIFYSDVSFNYFSQGAKVDTSTLLKELQKKDTLFPYTENTHFQAAFGHLTGYGAAYYGYQWSKVYAQDMFTKFAGKNVLSPKIGMAYRKKILAKGSGREEMDSVVDFLGRKPNSKAFFKSLGFEN